jgi:hypothetical protein
MEAIMVRPADRPLMSVRVSFEVTRLSPQHLVDAYARLVPVIPRPSRQPARAVVPRPIAILEQGGEHG